MKLIDPFKLMLLLFAPEGETGSGGSSDLSNPFEDGKTEDDETNEDTKEEDDKVEDDADVDEDKEDEDDEEDEDKKDKEDDKDEEDEEEEDNDALRLTEITDIKKEYPDFFKKFPDIRAALFRDHRYTEIIGTPEDAEAAINKAGVLDAISKDILVDGNVAPFLETIKKENAAAMPGIAASFMEFISSNDKELYLEVAALPIKQLLRAAWREGGKDTDLGRAAAHIHKYFFRDLDIEGKTGLEDKSTSKNTKTKREQELEQKLADMDKKTLTEFESGVSNSYINKMINEIKPGLDKDDRLTEYMKSKLSEDILADIKSQLDKDPNYQAKMRSLWRQAKDANFNSDSKSRIINAALARAKSLVPTTRQRLVSEAFKTRKATNKDKTPTTTTKREDTPRKQPRKQDESRKPMSDLDVLRG